MSTASNVYDTSRELLAAVHKAGYKDVQLDDLNQAMASTGLHMPLGDSDLPDLLSLFGPRSAAQRGDWGPLIEAAKKVSYARANLCRDIVETARRNLFGTASPKFHTLDEAAAWIKSQAPSVGTNFVAKSQGLNQDGTPTWTKIMSLDLPYCGGNGLVAVVPVEDNTILDRLRVAAKNLITITGCPWQVHDAVTVILTDLYPIIPPIKISFANIGGRVWISRVTINYPWVPAWCVEQAYQDKAIRPSLPDYLPLSKRKRRKPAPKMQALREFLQRNDGLSWQQRFKLWNQEHPQSEYLNVRLFQSACQKANAS